MKHTLTLTTPAQAREQMAALWQVIVQALRDGRRIVVTAKTETRTLQQNSLLWSVLTDLSRQVQFVVDGRLCYVTPEDVKDILTAGLKRQNRMALGIDGGVVMLGERTSQMTIGEMVDLITLGHAFGDSKGVQWSRTSLGRDVPDEVAAPKAKAKQREEVAA